MKSGRGNGSIERRADGWWVLHPVGSWTEKFGPYRWRWVAVVMRAVNFAH